MEWHVDAADVQAVRRSRHEFADHVRCRSNDAVGVAIAEVAYSELISNVHRHVGGPAWITLDWSGEHPVLTVRDGGPGFIPRIQLPDPSAPGGRGLYLVQQLAGDITVESDQSGARVSVQLPLRRSATP